jgi:hypothetical protein
MPDSNGTNLLYNFVCEGSHGGRGGGAIRHGRQLAILTGVVVGVMGWMAVGHAHQDPCHRLHSCPSDRNTYVCGDLGHCDQCLDNQYCLAGEPRAASSASPTPAPPVTRPSEPTSPGAVTVCFTPGGNCTDLIVKTLADAKRDILVQACSFTSAPIAKALLDAHKRGVQVQVILDASNRTDK